jgi:hypothetical protein
VLVGVGQFNTACLMPWAMDIPYALTNFPVYPTQEGEFSWIQTPHTTALGQFYLRFKAMKKKSYAMQAMYY